MKKITFFSLSTLLVLLFSTTVGYGQGTFDGSYCPGPGAPGDEYAASQNFVPSVIGSGTCAIQKVWAKVDNNTNTLRLGFKNGNSGTALFRIYLDSDNNPLSGLITDSGFGGGVPAGGAEYVLQINAQNGAFTLYKWNGITIVVDTLTPGLDGKNGDSNGCGGGDGQFFEFNIPFNDIGYDPCNSTESGEINLARYAAVAGGSPNSSLCSNQALDFNVSLSGSVTSNQTLCAGQASSQLTLNLTGGTSANIEDWQYSTNGGGTYADIGYGGQFTYSPGVLATGTHYYRVKIKNISLLCPTGTFTYSSPAIITVNAAPAAPTSNGDITECEESPIQTLDANDALSSTTGITWYSLASGGVVVTSPTLNTVGTATYYAEYNDGTCSSLTRTAVTLTINAAAVAPISGGNQTVCSDGSTTQTLTATATGGTITWYTAATGGSIVTSPTQVGVGSKTYYAESSNGTCS
ncbi:MAG TPA: hypothetical protein VIN72_11115, partial [Lutibacter sp.]